MNIINNIISNGMIFALPLFIMAVGGIYSERSGVTNLALEGLQGFGAFTGSVVAVSLAGYFGADSPVPVYLAIVCAMLGGMLFSLLHAVLCNYFKADMVISGIVINILAMALTAFFTKIINKNVFGEASDGFTLGIMNRFSIPGLSEIHLLGAFFTNMYMFEIIIVILAVITWYLLYKTSFGLHLRAAGDNPAAVDAAGIDVIRIRYFAVMMSGALSGLAGICFTYSITAKFSSSVYMGFGYLAIAALIFGGWKIMPTLAACIIFGFARSAGYQIVQALGLPSAYSDLVMILPYVLTLVLLIFLAGNSQAPRALGEAYDKSKR